LDLAQVSVKGQMPAQVVYVAKRSPFQIVKMKKLVWLKSQSRTVARA